MRPSSLVFLAASAAALAALFLLFRPPAPQPPPAAPSAAAPAPMPAPKVFQLDIQGRQLLAGPPVLQARQGDTVAITVRCDHAEEFHLHGYDRKLELRPGQAATLTLVADRSGRFEYELEHASVELGALEVQPR